MHVSGCFRTRKRAEARCWISGCLSAVRALGQDALPGINIALAGMAAKVIGLHNAQSAPEKW